MKFVSIVSVDSNVALRINASKLEAILPQVSKAAYPNGTYLEAHGFGLGRYIAAPLRIYDGLAATPGRPGHGMVFDWRGLDAVGA